MLDQSSLLTTAKLTNSRAPSRVDARDARSHMRWRPLDHVEKSPFRGASTPPINDGLTRPIPCSIPMRQRRFSPLHGATHASYMPHVAVYLAAVVQNHLRPVYSVNDVE